VDFGLSDGQRAIQGLARDILTGAAERRSGRGAAAPEPFDGQAWEELGRAGLLEIGIPESLGGSGGGIVEACVLLEEAGRAAMPLPVHPTLLLGVLPIARFGDDDQRARLLGSVVERSAVVAGSPPATSFGLPSPVVSATPDGTLRIGGVVDHVSAAAEAAWMVVSATGPDGAALFVVDLGDPGVEIVPQPEPGGEALSRVTFSGAPVEGKLAGRSDAVRWTAEHATVGLCALQVGLAERALQITADYTSTREQFGRPLASFQAVQQRAADAYIDVQAMRLTMWRAAWRLAADRPASDAVAVAGFFAAEAGQRVMAAVQHLHGGIGVDLDYPLHRYVLWSKQVELAVGGASANLARLGAGLAATAGEACG